MNAAGLSETVTPAAVKAPGSHKANVLTLANVGLAAGRRSGRDDGVDFLAAVA